MVCLLRYDHLCLCFLFLFSFLLGQDAASLFGVCQKTVLRAQKEGAAIFYGKNACIPIKKSRMDRIRVSNVIEFVDSKIPVISGRPYRIMTCTKKYLYESYAKEVPRPVSRGFFESHILDEFRIHYSSVPPSCVYCVGAKIESKKGSGRQLELHQARAALQTHHYLSNKGEVLLDYLKLLIVQDFTQIVFGSSCIQDLILTCYYKGVEKQHPGFKKI